MAEKRQTVAFGAFCVLPLFNGEKTHLKKTTKKQTKQKTQTHNLKHTPKKKQKKTTSRKGPPGFEALRREEQQAPSVGPDLGSNFAPRSDEATKRRVGSQRDRRVGRSPWHQLPRFAMESAQKKSWKKNHPSKNPFCRPVKEMALHQGSSFEAWTPFMTRVMLSLLQWIGQPKLLLALIFPPPKNKSRNSGRNCRIRCAGCLVVFSGWISVFQSNARKQFKHVTCKKAPHMKGTLGQHLRAILHPGGSFCHLLRKLATPSKRNASRKGGVGKRPPCLHLYP